MTIGGALIIPGDGQHVMKSRERSKCRPATFTPRRCMVYIAVLFMLGLRTVGAQGDPCWSRSTRSERTSGSTTGDYGQSTLCTAEGICQGGSTSSPSQHDELPVEYAFAQSLFDKGYYYQAVVEYERFLFYHPDHPLSGQAQLNIARCYQQGKQYKKALQQFRTVLETFRGTQLAVEAAFRIGETSYQAGEYEQCIMALTRFLDSFPQDARSTQALYRIGWAHIQLDEYITARDMFLRLGSRSADPDTDGYYAASRIIAERLLSLRDARERSPVAAAILSIVLPGAGHLYAGAYKDGLLAFLVNAALIGATYEAFDKEIYVAGGLVGAVGLGFYAGNVYGALNSAHHTNKERIQAIVRPLAKRYEYIDQGSSRPRGFEGMP